MTETRGRRATDKDKTADAEISAILGTPPVIAGVGLLEHGLNDGDDLYVWANKISRQDISAKLSAGFRLVKLADIRKRLEENGIPAGFYEEDVNGNVCYGVDLILMVGSKARQEKIIRMAYNDQYQLVQDASESEMQSKLDEALSTTNIRAKDRPRISKDEDHGTKQTISLDKETK